jgi:hypothetical protein
MARASIECIFCGHRPTTSEHIWAKWLRRYIAMPLVNHHAAAAMLNADRTVTITRKRWGGDPRQRGLEVVCKRCNETWMGGLQELRATPAQSSGGGGVHPESETR